MPTNSFYNNKLDTYVWTFELCAPRFERISLTTCVYVICARVCVRARDKCVRGAMEWHAVRNSFSGDVISKQIRRIVVVCASFFFHVHTGRVVHMVFHV